jgi:shikimate dehydrogenase
MKLFGLIGKPLSHSFSKKYFTEKFEREHVKGHQYDLYPLESIDDIKELLKNKDLAGLNVTIPYKQAVLPFLDEVSDVVADANACNCIKIVNGKLIGYNTDVIGIEKTLLPFLKPCHTDALILGTGGASNAVQYVLRKANINYQLVSRNPDAGHLGYERITGDIMKQHKLIINCTPLGTYPNVDDAPAIDYNSITAEHVLFDLVYNPAKTLFLQKGEEQGASILNGMPLLELQAEASWEIWTR